jgi:hypothetical protein
MRRVSRGRLDRPASWREVEGRGVVVVVVVGFLGGGVGGGVSLVGRGSVAGASGVMPLG